MTRDVGAALVVAMVLIPSAMAYAVLAGLPPYVGLHASVLPLILYPLVGRSRIVSVGPVTIVSLMTATALAPFANEGPEAVISAAAVLAMLSALMLLIASRLDVARYLDAMRESVLAGFLSAVGIIIACSQIKHLVGARLPKTEIAPLYVVSAVTHLPNWNVFALAIGGSALAAMIWKTEIVRWLLQRADVDQRHGAALGRAMPLIVVAAAIAVTMLFGLATRGLDVVGPLPKALPTLTLPQWPSIGLNAWWGLVVSAALLSAIGFLECASVVKGLESKSGERLDVPRELAGLAMANVGAGLSGGYPVSGGTVRSVVNFNAGAATPLANLWTGVIVLATLVLFAGLIAHLPMAILAAIVTAAALSIINLKGLVANSEARGPASLAGLLTFLATLLSTPEIGLLVAIALSMMPDAWLALAWRWLFKRVVSAQVGLLSLVSEPKPTSLPINATG